MAVDGAEGGMYENSRVIELKGTQGRSSRLRRQVSLSNQIGLFGAAATVPYQLFYALYNFDAYLPVFSFNLIFMAIHVSVLFSNSSQHFRLARNMALVNGCAQIFVVTYFIGAPAGVHLFYFAIGTILALVLRRHHPGILFSLLGLLVILFIVCELLFAVGETPVPRPWVDVMCAVSALFALGLAGGFSYLFRVEIDQAEDKLRESNQALRKLSTTDALTGLANRRHLDQFLEQEWARNSREEYSLSALMCDVDCFKAYNDHFGHQAGDACLSQIGQTLDHLLQRPSDFAARYGGEEFAVILPQTNEEGARLMAERIRAAVENLAIPHPCSNVADRVTLSIGASTLAPEQHDLTPELLSHADVALYQAKAEGRNRVVFKAVDASYRTTTGRGLG